MVLARYRIRIERVYSMDCPQSKFKQFEVILKSGSIPYFSRIYKGIQAVRTEFLVLIYYILTRNLRYLFYKIQIFSGSKDI